MFHYSFAGLYGGMAFVDDVYDDTQDGKAVNYPEAIFIDNTKIYALNLNYASPIWTLRHTDASGRTTLNAFDFNGDGVKEIVYRDEANMRIMNGNLATPTNYATFPATSGTWAEGPVVADVDNDGQAEIVMVSDDTLSVYEAGPGTTWQNARKVWNQRGYHYTNISDDLTVPVQEHGAYLELPKGSGRHPFNAFHSQFNAESLKAAPGYVPTSEVAVTIDSATVVGSDLKIGFTLTNNGSAAFVAGASVSFYDKDPTAAGSALVGTMQTSSALAEGASVSLTYTATGKASLKGVYAIANDDGKQALPLTLASLGNATGVLECDYSNNKASLGMNSAPVITSNGGGDTATVTLAEKDTAVTTVIATDADAGDTLTYSISGGTDAALFSINASGKLAFKAASALGSYQVIVKVDDGKGGTDTQTLTVVADKDTDGDGLFDSIDQDDDNDGLPDLGECKFGKPVGGLPISLLNEGFELPVQTAQLSFPLNGQVPGWITSATDNSFEFWRDSFLSVPAYEGHQHVELNAYEVSTLYQKIATKPGDVLQWSFAHRGRSGDDTIALHIGAEGAALDASNKQGEYTTGNTAWKVYTGTYTVPAGQTVTQFAYKSVSAAGGNPAVGNFLDAISFSLLPPCTAADVDSDGIPNMNDLDSDNDGIPDNVEAQTTAGYKVPTGTVNANGIDTAYGTGLTLVDTDGDLTPDFVDTNTDNAQTDDTTEAVLTLASKDSDGDGLDDAVDSDDAKFGPANAGITDVAATYPAAGGEVGWRTTTVVNSAPVITSDGGGASANLSKPENQTAVTTVTATDANSDPLTYSITGGADAALFSIVPATGVVTFKAAPDFENPADAGTDNVYNLQVTVADGKGGTKVQDLAVTITNANDAPVITSDGSGATANLSKPENQTAVTTVTATDPDVGDTRTLQHHRRNRWRQVQHRPDHWRIDLQSQTQLCRTYRCRWQQYLSGRSNHHRCRRRCRQASPHGDCPKRHGR